MPKPQTTRSNEASGKSRHSASIWPGPGRGPSALGILIGSLDHPFGEVDPFGVAGSGRRARRPGRGRRHVQLATSRTRCPGSMPTISTSRRPKWAKLAAGVVLRCEATEQ